MIRSRERRNRRPRRGTRPRTSRDHCDEPLRALVRTLARQAAREHFARELAAQRPDRPAHVVRRGRRVQAETGGQESALHIELRGNLAAMLTMATRLRARESGGATAGFGPDFAGPQNATRSPETGDLELQIAMVAGARNQRYLRLWTAVA